MTKETREHKVLSMLALVMGGLYFKVLVIADNKFMGRIVFDQLYDLIHHKPGPWTASKTLLELQIGPANIVIRSIDYDADKLRGNEWDLIVNLMDNHGGYTAMIKSGLRLGPNPIMI